VKCIGHNPQDESIYRRFTEDKIVQQAVVAILNQIYEVDFKGFSSGFFAFCTLIPMRASTPLILRKSRMRKRARTALCGGRSLMVVPTATVNC